MATTIGGEHTIVAASGAQAHAIASVYALRTGHPRLVPFAARIHPDGRIEIEVVGAEDSSYGDMYETVRDICRLEGLPRPRVDQLDVLYPDQYRATAHRWTVWTASIADTSGSAGV